MKLLNKVLPLVIILFSLNGCNSDDQNETPASVGYQEQYNIDIAKIETYLKTHSITVTNNPNATNDQDATFATVPNLDPTSIWGSDPTTPKADLLIKNATFSGVVHKIYYLRFREGVGENPTLNNQVRTYYKGILLNGTVFDQSTATGATFPLSQLILGWQEIFPLFKSGLNGVNGQSEDFGAGVMFLPSAYAYYNQSPGNGAIPAYSPLIFSFKLFDVL